MPAVNAVARFPLVVVRAVRAGGSIECATPPLVRELMHVPRLIVRTPRTQSRAQACPMGRDRKTPCRNTTLENPIET